MSTPTRNSGSDKDWGVLRDRNAHGEVGHAAREVHIRMDVLLVKHDGLHFVAKIKPTLLGGILLVGVFEAPLTQDASTRI